MARAHQFVVAGGISFCQLCGSDDAKDDCEAFAAVMPADRLRQLMATVPSPTTVMPLLRGASTITVADVQQMIAEHEADAPVGRGVREVQIRSFLRAVTYAAKALKLTSPHHQTIRAIAYEGFKDYASAIVGWQAAAPIEGAYEVLIRYAADVLDV